MFLGESELLLDKLFNSKVKKFYRYGLFIKNFHEDRELEFNKTNNKFLKFIIGLIKCMYFFY